MVQRDTTWYFSSDNRQSTVVETARHAIKKKTCNKETRHGIAQVITDGYSRETGDNLQSARTTEVMKEKNMLERDTTWYCTSDNRWLQ
jgi:hypothetical protein